MRPLALILPLLLASCGEDDSVVYRCDLRTAAMPLDYCQEYEGLTGPTAVDAYKGQCTGTWAASECPREDTLGGCQAPESSGIVITNWFYPASGGDQTAADVEAGCTSPDTYVAP